MPVYAFTALDTEGKSCKGTLDAESARAARSQLRERSLIPLDVEAVGHPGASDAAASGSSARRVLRGGALGLWTRQLAELVSAGLPLERALNSLMHEADTEAMRQLHASLRTAVNGGASFASALEQAPKDFSSVYIAVVRGGEQGGDLGQVLQRLADDLEERDALRNKLLGAALYPTIVSAVALCIVLFLVTYVVPQVASVFAGTRQTLPVLTRGLMAVSDFTRNYGWLLLAAVAVSAMGLRWALQQPHIRHAVDVAILRMPLWGRLARSYNGARFASTLSMLSGAGVPILQALQAAADTLGNEALRQDALDALMMVREGAPLASALAQKPRFPSQLALFARLGEQTGQLPATLERAARQLGNEVQRRSMQIATVLEPLLIAVMGAVVLVIVLAVLLPIIQLNQWVA